MSNVLLSDQIIQILEDHPRKPSKNGARLNISSLSSSYSILSFLEFIGVYTASNQYYLTVSELLDLQNGIVSPGLDEWFLKNELFGEYVYRYLNE